MSSIFSMILNIKLSCKNDTTFMADLTQRN